MNASIGLIQAYKNFLQNENTHCTHCRGFMSEYAHEVRLGPNQNSTVNSSAFIVETDKR